jgi:transcription-repair coupling factor (superfamily II helicase)
MLPVETFEEVELIYFVGKIRYKRQMERKKFETMMKVYKELSKGFGHFKNAYDELFDKMQEIKTISAELSVSKYRKTAKIEKDEFYFNAIIGGALLLIVIFM